jgi:hypothetical protein
VPPKTNDDTDKHERIDPVALCPEVIQWAEMMAQAARHYKLAPEIIADFDLLCQQTGRGLPWGAAGEILARPDGMGSRSRINAGEEG